MNATTSGKPPQTDPANAPHQENGDTQQAAPADAFKNRAAVVLAIAILVVYVVMVAVLWGKTGAKDLKWTRWVFLLTGIEAIAFAAVGWLFGKEVHRAQAETAAAAQQNAQTAAKQVGEAQAKGNALAEAVRAHAATAESLPGVEGASATRPPPAALVEMADRLFPHSQG